MNDFHNDLEKLISQQLKTDLDCSQVELTKMVAKWAYSNLLLPTDENCIKIYNKLNDHNRLRANMLVVNPDFIGSSKVILHNLIEYIDPSYELLTDEGCRLIYEVCYSLMTAIPISGRRPSKTEAYAATAALRDYPEAKEAADELYVSAMNGFVNAGPACLWASHNSSTARHIHELTKLLGSCAFEAPVTIPNIVALCYNVADEFGDSIYKPVDCSYNWSARQNHSLHQ